MYNWKKDTLVLVTPEGGLRFFYKQIIMGDGADNIKGAKGVGPKGAEKALDGLNDEREMYDKCVDIYKSVGMTEEEVISNARLLWLRREIGEIWEPPNENQKKGEG
jgi:5'-3' exonuclease